MDTKPTLSLRRKMNDCPFLFRAAASPARLSLHIPLNMRTLCAMQQPVSCRSGRICTRMLLADIASPSDLSIIGLAECMDCRIWRR